MNKVRMLRRLMTIGFLFAGFASASAGPGLDGPLLVLWDSSDFKDALVDEVAMAARSAGLEVVVDDSVRSVKKADLTDFAAVVVVNTGKAGRMSRAIRKVLDGRVPVPVVVVTTYADISRSRDPDYSGADCITTASLEDTASIRALAGEILAGIGLD